MELAQFGGGVRIEKVRADSPAIAKGVAPLSTVLEVNGKSVSGLSAAEVQALVRSSPRPISIRLDDAAFRALSPADQTKTAAQSLGMATDTLQVQVLSGPRDPRCGYLTRESDVIEVEFTAKVIGGGEFDSSAARSGRPFAYMLGNGDVVKGLELGTLEMCIGERRRVTVPPALGFGSRGSRMFGVPPGASLEYDVALVSINMQTDPKARRVDIDDEQRFSEDEQGNIVNAAEL